MIRIFLTEFAARGLGWLRLMVLPFLIGHAEYAFIVLLVSAEAMLGDIIVAPHRRKIMMARSVDFEPVSASLRLWLITAPVQAILAYYFFEELAVVFAVLLCTFFYSQAQALMLNLRVVDVPRYNQAKLEAYLLSTGVFFVVTLAAPKWYPVTTCFLFATLLRHVDVRAYGRALAFGKIGRGWPGIWLHFGFQAAAMSVWQYGNRFVAGLHFSALVLTEFMQNFLLVSGITFVYAALMIVYERSISIEIKSCELPARNREAARLFFILAGAWLLYVLGLITLLVVREYLPNAVKHGIDWVQPGLLLSFACLFLARAGQLAFLPVLVAIGDNSSATTSAALAALFQILAYGFFWPVLTPIGIAVIMTGSLYLSLAVIFARLAFFHRMATLPKEMSS